MSEQREREFFVTNADGNKISSLSKEGKKLIKLQAEEAKKKREEIERQQQEDYLNKFEVELQKAVQAVEDILGHDIPKELLNKKLDESKGLVDKLKSKLTGLVKKK